MSIHTPSRVHAGVTEGGQFATGARSEPAVSLDEADPNELANMLGDGADWDTGATSNDGPQSAHQWRQEQQQAAGEYRSAEARLERASVGTAATAILDRYPTAHEIKMQPGDRGLFNEPSVVLDRHGQMLATSDDLRGDGDDVTELLSTLGRSYRHYPFMHIPTGHTLPVFGLSTALEWARTPEEQT